MRQAATPFTILHEIPTHIPFLLTSLLYIHFPDQKCDCIVDKVYLSLSRSIQKTKLLGSIHSIVPLLVFVIDKHLVLYDDRNSC